MLWFLICLFLAFSHPPAPVAASLEPDSPTQELDSILQELMSLGQEVSPESMHQNDWKWLDLDSVNFR